MKRFLFLSFLALTFSGLFGQITSVEYLTITETTVYKLGGPQTEAVVTYAPDSLGQSYPDAITALFHLGKEGWQVVSQTRQQAGGNGHIVTYLLMRKREQPVGPPR